MDLTQILNRVHHSDCVAFMKMLPDNCIDSIVTYPPYELGFMGKSWDNTGIANNKEMRGECLRILKPGGHLLAFSGTRTYHRMACAIEDAGFEVRDMIEWVYGSGFPKSLNIGKAVDKLQGNERIPYERPDFVARSNKTEQRKSQVICGEKGKYTKGTSEREGRGTALKPAHEPICMARKPKDDKLILDACCGGKMFWFDKNHPNTLYVDKRVREAGHCKHRKNHSILPDEIVDFTMMPFSDNSFKMVVFDPPHIFGKETGNMTKQYGWLEKSNWREQIKKGFDECWRVLDDYGTLIFKWNENAVTKKEIIDLIGKTPLFGHQVGGKMQTHWMSFMKIPQEQHEEINPNHNPICMARKPIEGTVAENCLKWGTGGINIDGSRVGTEKITINGGGALPEGGGCTWKEINEERTGRFPANIITDGSEEVRECFPESGGGKPKHNSEIKRAGMKSDGSSFNTKTSGFNVNKGQGMANFGDSGNASRFFKSILYYAKAGKAERNAGLEDLPYRKSELNSGGIGRKISVEKRIADGSENAPTMKNHHPTVKPIALMEYLIKMVTKEGGIVFDPFTGSGTTLVAAKKNGFQYLGTEMTEEYIPIIEARLNATEFTPKEEEIIDKGRFG